MPRAPVVTEPLALSVDVACGYFMFTQVVPEVIVPKQVPLPPRTPRQSDVLGDFAPKCVTRSGGGAVPDPSDACSIKPPETWRLHVALGTFRKVLLPPRSLCLPGPQVAVVPAAPRGPGGGLCPGRALE